MDDLLQSLVANARLDNATLAKTHGLAEAEVAERIADYEQRGIIKGYQAILNEDQLDGGRVTAVIEVSMTPERGGGFDRTAARIAKFPQVSSMYLMSGDFDLMMFVQGDTLQEVAQFVSEKLSTIPGVTGTATHFMLKTYKHRGVLMHSEEAHERLKVSP